MTKSATTFLRRAHVAWILGVAILSLVGSGHASSHDWLLGQWTGQYTRGTEIGSVTMTFRDEAGSLKWTWTAETREGNNATAEGLVTKIDQSSAELEGKYTDHPVRVLVGTGMKLSFKSSPTTLSGTGITERVNRPFGVELSKSK